MSRLALALVLAAIAGLAALGVWQLDRRSEKLALIARVERRLAAPPVSPPRHRAGRDDAYARVHVRGRYLTGRDTRVRAATALGPGWWILTPLHLAGGGILLVNRGFVPAGADAGPPAAGPVTITGLLRLSEPGGGFLRRNDPGADRWYSRDVAAIAMRRRLGPTASWFLDAERDGRGWPRGGMTVVRFANNHLVYALTWFGLAGLLGLMTLRARRAERGG